MGIFERLKKYIERKKEEALMYEGENEFIRLNHLEKRMRGEDGKYSLIHTSGYVYELPKEMSSEFAMYVLSFLQDKISTDLNVGIRDVKNMEELNEILSRFHFKRLIHEKIDESEILDLVISTDANLELPNKDALEIDERYWRFSNIPQKLIENIYNARNEKIDLSPLTKFESDFKYGTSKVIYPKQEPKTM